MDSCKVQNVLFTEKLTAGYKNISFKNVYTPGMLPVDYVCNDAFLPLEGAVPLYRSK